MDFQKQAVAEMRKHMKIIKPDSHPVWRKGMALFFTLALLILSFPVHAFSVNQDSPLIEVKDIQHLSAPGYDRVIIALSDVAQFATGKLSDPERLFIDFKHAVPGRELKKEMQVNQGFLKSVRASRYDAGTVRVVLDMTDSVYEEKFVVLKDSPSVLIDISPEKQVHKPEVFAEIQKTAQVLPEKYAANSTAEGMSEKTQGQSVSFEAGFKAEMEGQFEKALSIYKSIVEKNPERRDLWVRISDIHARMGNAMAAAGALHEAEKLSSNDAALSYRLSQAYAAANQPGPALAAIERAVELDPARAEYLDARGKLATWNGQYAIAADSYERVLKLTPDNDAALLNLARVASWSGALSKADKHYRMYLKKHPEDGDALIERVKIKTWMGNYPVALSLLETYHKAFGETRDSLREKARVLAWANRPQRASAIILPQLETTPDDYALNYSHTLALFYAKKYSEAVESLKTIRKLGPDVKQTEDIEKFVMTPLRSHVDIGFNFYHDSDSLDIYSWFLSGTYALKPETRLEARIDMDYLRADEGSGLENIDGDESTWHRSGRIGIMHRFTDKIAADGYFGWAYAENSDNVIYGIGTEIRPRDELLFRLSREYGYSLDSARTASLGIKRGINRLSMQWEPDLRYPIVATLGYDTLSDDNERWEVMVAPRRMIMRSQTLNLDIGVNAWRFGYDKDPNHGYYAPKLYQRYSLANFLYWKINDNNGVSVTGGIGIHKDDSMDGFRMTYDASFDGTFGIYSDWMLKVRGGITHNLRRGEAFEAYTLGASLTRRF